MKKILLYALAIFLTGGMISSCSEEKLGDSIFDTNPPARTELDNWLLRNYVKEYNIDFKYRLEDIEANMSYNHIPAEVEKSISCAEITIWFSCIRSLIKLLACDEKIDTRRKAPISC